MSRIATRFQDLRAVERKALITFITAGDPDFATTGRLLDALVDAGADLLELGIPFSDPMADGPVIERASERALAAGATLAGVLECVTSFRTRDDRTPIVLMGYLNPIETMGYARFAQAAAHSGVDGVIVVDLPPEEATDLHRELLGHGIDLIFLIAPTTDLERIKRICEIASGFVYYVSLKGVTGAASLDVDSVARMVASIKSVTELPIGVGFGIGDAQSAAAVARVSDAAVVGSVLVAEVEKHAGEPERLPAALTGIVAAMRGAMDASA